MRLLRKLFIVSLALFMLSSVTAFAADTEDDVPNLVMQAGSKANSIVGELTDLSDTASYEIKVDHAIYPEFVLYASLCGSDVGNAVLTITDETGKQCGKITLTGRIEPSPDLMTYTATQAKSYKRISNNEGAVKTYTITATTETGHVGYKISVGTIDDIYNMLGGVENIATTGKNSPDLSGPQSSDSFAVLLQGAGDYFRYTADGVTYIAIKTGYYSDIAFEVIDPDTGKYVYRSMPNDIFIRQYSSTLYSYIAQKKLDLQAGKTYYIRAYAPSSVNDTDYTKKYQVYIGLPSLASETLSYISKNTYSVTANKLTTFKINVTGQPNSARLNSGATAGFKTKSSLNNAYISYCKITAPNGTQFICQNGNGRLGSLILDFDNYLASKTNIPVNGTWVVEIKAEKSLSGLQLYIGGTTLTINSNEEY